MSYQNATNFVFEEGIEIPDVTITTSEDYNPYCPICEACGIEECCSPLRCQQKPEGTDCEHYLEILKENYRQMSHVHKLVRENPNNYDLGDAVRIYINQLYE